LFLYNFGIVSNRVTGRDTLEINVGARPDGPSLATVTAIFITHHRAPISALHEAMTIGKRLSAIVQRPVVTRADEMADLVRKRIHGGCTVVMQDRKCVLILRCDPYGQSAPHWIVDDEDADVGTMLVPQSMD
jgi:hypothetical protein